MKIRWSLVVMTCLLSVLCGRPSWSGEKVNIAMALSQGTTDSGQAENGPAKALERSGDNTTGASGEVPTKSPSDNLYQVLRNERPGPLHNPGGQNGAVERTDLMQLKKDLHLHGFAFPIVRLNF